MKTRSTIKALRNFKELSETSKSSQKLQRALRNFKELSELSRGVPLRTQ